MKLLRKQMLLCSILFLVFTLSACSAIGQTDENNLTDSATSAEKTVSVVRGTITPTVSTQTTIVPAVPFIISSPENGIFNTAVELEEKIIILQNKLQSIDLSSSRADSISNKIKELKANIKSTYFSTQELFITTYFSTIFKSLITSSDLDRFRKKLYNFQELTGNTDNYYFFNNFYIEMMEKLDKRFDMLAELDSHSTYLIPRKESTFSKIIKYIKKLLLKREFEIDKK